jgi:hypothetical protein
VRQKESEIRALSENCQKLELQLNLRDQEFRKETEVLKENLALFESENSQLQELCKSLEL